MFSEYASRFLAQSQSRLSLGQPDPDSTRNPSNRHGHDRRSSSRLPPNRPSLQRPNMPNPYITSASSRFAFPRLNSMPPAPLFYSAADDFREEGDGEEYNREVADLHALQKSRRNFGSHLTASSELEDEHQEMDRSGDGDDSENSPPNFTRGIKSSWRGENPGTRGRSAAKEPALREFGDRGLSVGLSEASEPSSKGKGKLVDVELASTVHSERDTFIDDLSEYHDDKPPAVQQFRNSPPSRQHRSPLRATLPIPEETDEETMLQHPPPTETDGGDVSPTIEAVPDSEKHDTFWFQLFIICQCATFGAYFLVLLQTSAPDRKNPLGDTIYTVLLSSYHLLGVYSLVSIIVGLLWLALLRSFARPLILSILVAVPVISFSFFLYPFISSFKGSSESSGIQDAAMRWFSIVPLLVAIFWTYTVIKARHSVTKAMELLEFSGKILTAMSPLLLVGLATLAAVVTYTWVWMLMFTRLFLEGHFSSGKRMFVPDFSTWWLAIGFILDYLWTLGVIAGIQRATTAATVSQWYFHRNAQPPVSSRVVVNASMIHGITTMAGTICLSTFLSLLIRAPLLVLPRRFAGTITMCIYSLIPASIATLTNPLTLTYASVHSQNLRNAANSLSQMSFVARDSPTTALTPRSFSARNGPGSAASTLLPYRLAKLLLHALRFVMSLTLGFGGWVTTARMLEIANEGSTTRGSMYAYVIGLIAAAIGWGVLGAMEGVMGGILDALVICWGSEVGVHGLGEVRYCREAGQLLGDDRARGRWA